jgi:hypothetical protein
VLDLFLCIFLKMSSPGKKPVIRSQTREIIFNVFKYFKSVKCESDTLKNLKDKTSLATGRIKPIFKNYF